VHEGVKEVRLVATAREEDPKMMAIIWGMSDNEEK
jgi:hypothetical protein